jgi:hypothetical protein
MSRPISAWAARAAGIVIVLACVCQVQANSLDWTYKATKNLTTGAWEFAEASPGKHAARATFNIISGTTLTIELTNTYLGGDFWEPTDVLTGVLFDFGDPYSGVELAPTSATIASGSQAYVVPKKGPDAGTLQSLPYYEEGELRFEAPFEGDVSGEWAYRGDLGPYFKMLNLPLPAYGISATGMEDLIGSDNIFMEDDNIAAEDLWPPQSPDGIQAGITGTLPDGTLNGGLLDEPLVTDTVVFTLEFPDTSPLPDVDDIVNVWFHYGTDGFENGLGPAPPYIPEPLTMLGVLVGIGGLTRYVRKRRMS